MIVAIFRVLSIINLNVGAISFGDYGYIINVDGKSATITDYYGIGGKAVISKKLSNLIVSKVSFSGNSDFNNVTHLVIPNGI